MLYDICYIFVLFLSYAIMGWIVECIFCSIVDKKLVYDRGFLLGPYCPIYGYGALYMYFFLQKYQNDPVVLFIMAMVGTTILEYFTSFWMEKIFKARWWDYSNQKFNIEGRVCLLNSFLFGVLGIFFIYVINPFYTGIINQIPNNIFIGISIILMIGFLIDNILTFTILEKLKLKVGEIKKDATSEIDSQIREFLSHYNFYIKRLFKAFPTMEIQSNIEQLTDTIRNNIDKFNKDRKEFRKKQKQKIKELKKSLKN